MRMKRKKASLRRFKRQRCSVCNCEDKFNFFVPNELWREIVPVEFHNRVVCLPCFDEFAREQNVDYSDALDALYFAGSRASFKFQTVSAQSA